MKRNRVTEKSYPNSQTLKERIEMTSRMRSVAFKALLVGLASLILVFAGPVSTVLADGSHHNSPGNRDTMAAYSSTHRSSSASRDY
jgi:hypothetical protein